MKDGRGIMMNFLEENEIVKYLKTKDSEFYHLIIRVYSFCSRVLGEIPKEFSNYTLHDIGHASRVTNYMTDFLKNCLENYSYLHLAMVIFAGLLHDTGMFVSDDEIAMLKKKEQDGLNIQDYVRKHHARRVKKVLDQEISAGCPLKSLFQVENDYYYGDVLAKICESHTEDCSWIRKNIRNKLILANYEANPQQIAILLRIGDNLDIDNRRAPGYLAKMLNVKGYSREEWEKHVHITNYDKVKITSEFPGFTVFFEGNCDDPFCYRKVCEHINWVENDYKDIVGLLKTFPEKYNIRLNPNVENNIETIGFECTDLVFHLNYEKIVKLLMGENIYESKQAGMRELIQNSIDAVKIMAEQIRKMPDPYDYHPTVKIILNEAKNEIIVSDNGIGMSSETLKQYFFNIGTSYYDSDEFKKNNPTYEPIGRYGIGFLACFMLSTTIKLETQCIENERIRIDFEKGSPFVIKRECYELFSEGHGTRIFLNYNEVIGPIFENVNELKKYLQELLLTDDYDLRIVKDGKEENIQTSLKNESSGKLYLASDKDFDVYYSFALKPQITTSLFELKYDANDVWYYFDKIGEGFIDKFGYNENPFSLVLMESVYENDNLSNDNYHYSFVNYITEDLLGIKCTKSNVKYDIIEPRFLELLFKDDTISYWQVPYLENERDLDLFLKKIETVDYEVALVEYDSRLKYFYICGKDLELEDFNSIQLSELADRVISIDEEKAYYYKEGYVPYPFKPERIVLKARRERKNCGCWIFENGTKDLSHIAKVFMHGIRVNNAQILFPNYVRNMRFDKLVINVKTNIYSLNVARNKFDKDSERRMGDHISRLIYEDIINRNNMKWSKKEREDFKNIINDLYLS